MKSNNIKDKASNMVQQLFSRTQDVIEAGRQQIELNLLQQKLSEQHKLLGRLVADLAKKDESTQLDLNEPEVARKLSYIHEFEEQIAYLRKLIYMQQADADTEQQAEPTPGAEAGHASASGETYTGTDEAFKSPQS